MSVRVFLFHTLRTHKRVFLLHTLHTHKSLGPALLRIEKEIMTFSISAPLRMGFITQ